MMVSTRPQRGRHRQRLDQVCFQGAKRCKAPDARQKLRAKLERSREAIQYFLRGNGLSDLPYQLEQCAVHGLLLRRPLLQHARLLVVHQEPHIGSEYRIDLLLSDDPKANTRSAKRSQSCAILGFQFRPLLTEHGGRLDLENARPEPGIA